MTEEAAQPLPGSLPSTQETKAGGQEGRQTYEFKASLLYLNISSPGRVIE